MAANPQQLHALERERFSRLLGYALPDHISRKEALALGKRKELISTKKELLGNFDWVLGSAFNRIAQSGFFTPIWYSDVPHVQPYYMCEIAAFLEFVNKQSRGNGSGIRQVLLHTAIVKGKDKAVPVLLSRILRGDLPLFGSHSGGFLSSFTLPLDDAPKGEIIDVGHIDAAFILGVNVGTVGQLTFHGHLQKSDDCTSIHIQSLDNFARSYITAARLGAICSSAMHAEAIENLLVDAGVQRVLPPNNQMIFSREAAVRAFYQNWSWDLEPLQAVLDNTVFASAA